MEEAKKVIQRNDNHVRVVVKLPSVITKEDWAEVRKLGYVLDPNSRLASTKAPIGLSQGNIGTVFFLLKEEVKRSIGIYEEKDWSHLQRDCPIFSF